MKRHLFLLTIIAFLLATNIHAQKWPDEERGQKNFLTGKIYDFDRKWFLKEYVMEVKGVFVRAVHLETGVVRELETQGDGCYSFSDIPEGHYALSVIYKGTDPEVAQLMQGEFKLADSVEVKSEGTGPTVVAACLALKNGNVLEREFDCPLCPRPDFKEHRSEAHVAGKVFDFDGNWSIEEIKNDLNDLWVRIVHLKTGKSRETTTSEDGCYSFKDVPEGVYTFSVYYRGNNPRMLEKIKGVHVLPDRVRVERLENRAVVVAVCVVLEKDLKLRLLHECHVCLKTVPPIAFYFMSGAAAPVILLSGEEDPPEGSTFRPASGIAANQ